MRGRRMQAADRAHIDGAAIAPVACTSRGGAGDDVGCTLLGGEVVAGQPSGASGNGGPHPAAENGTADAAQAMANSGTTLMSL